ncbi:MAG: hypothetical protein RR014_04955, partial [Bilophila sp.]
VIVLFGGLAFMFYCVLRSQEALLKVMREEHALVNDRLNELEARVSAGFGSLRSLVDAANSLTGEYSDTAPVEPCAPANPNENARYAGGSPLDEMCLQLEPSAPSSPSYAPSSRHESGLPDLKM